MTDLFISFRCCILENSTSFDPNQNRTEPFKSTGNTTRRELIKFSDFLGTIAFVFIFLGLFIETVFSGTGNLSLAGFSVVIVGCVFLGGFLYLKIKLIETRK